MLQEGDKAPNFKGKDQNGNTIHLHDYKGKKLIIFFYPEDDTPTCTATACNLRDNHRVLINKGYAVIGVSPDDSTSHHRFADKFHLPFPLIADTDKKILEAYEAWGEKNVFGNIVTGVIRKTYVIDEHGHIEKIFKKVDADHHTEQILNAIEA